MVPSIRLLSALLFGLSLLTLAPGTLLAQDSDAPQQGPKVTPPKLVQKQEAKYTQEAIDARAEGAVKMRLTIDANGKVTKVEVLSGPGYGLNESARQAASAFVFTPAIINGVPAPVTLGFTINFTLPILPAEFKGSVVDSGNGKGLPGVKVGILYKGPDPLPEGVEPPKATTTTDANGNFSFANVPAGTYAVRLELDAYRDFATEIDLVQGKTSEAEYKVQSQPINLKGVVKEAGTRKILAGVKVDVQDKAGKVVRSGFTDAKGNFGFRGLAPGAYSVRVKGQGYLAAAFDETVKANEVSNVTYYVESAYYDEYTVRTNTRRAAREVTKQTLKLEEVRRIPGTGGDVVRVVQNLPGVARPSFVSGAIIVRGAAPQDTQTFLGGDNIPLIFHFFGGPSVISSEMIESIDFYAGNFSVKYGRALAGIIDLNTRDPKTDRIHGLAEIDLLDASLLIEGPITENLSFAVSGRRSYYDTFLKFVIPEDTVDIVAAPVYYDYQAWLTYKGLTNSKLELFVYGSSDRVELLLPEGDPQGNADFQTTGVDFANGFQRAQLRWTYRPPGKIKNDLMVSFGQNDTSFELSENLFFLATFSQLQLRNELSMQLRDNVEVRVGADLQVGNVSFEFEIPRFSNDGNDRGNDRDGSGSGGRPNFGRDGAEGNRSSPFLNPAFYAEADIKLWDRLQVIPGVRLDYFGQLAEASISPRVVARLDLPRNVALKGGAGYFTQPSNPGSTDPDLGNPNLTFEKAYQYSLGTEWKPLEYLEFGVTGFYRDSFDLTSNTSEFTVDDDGNTRPLIFSNEGEGRAYGAEFLLRHYPNNRFFGWVAYTLSKSERRNIETRQWQPYRFDQRHILTVLGGYNLPYGFDISARFRLVSGNPYTPTVGGAYNVEEDQYSPVYGTPFSARNPTFRQLDLRLDKKWVFETWILGAYLDVLNVTNTDNAEGQRFNYDYTQQAPVLGLPILPTLGVNAKF